MLLFLVNPVFAQETLKFRLPLACTPGTDCWVMNYADIGPDKDEKATDSACLSRTYEEHKGTDFAILDEAAMKRGVDVLAASDGTVSKVRDGEIDSWKSEADLEQVKKDKKECGNAVLTDHGNGWQTLNCHMKKGSLTVKPGDVVKAGDKIGQVGLSGMTQFPHLHFGVIHDAVILDPFTGQKITDPCGQKTAPLWDTSLKLAYEPVTFFALGFDIKPPVLINLDKERIDRKRLRADASALIFHAVMLGVRENDDITLTIEGPDGKIFATSSTIQEKTRARQMLYVGRKIPEGSPLKPGTYKGKVTIARTKEDGTKQQFSDERILTVE